MAVKFNPAQPYLLVETTKIAQSEDSQGKWDHYSLSLITEKNEQVPIGNAKKYKNISQIVIDDGMNKTVLNAEESFRVARLIDFFTTDFDDFRKQINDGKVDFHGDYPNKHTKFDSKRFSYYLKYGLENTYAYKTSDAIFKRNFRDDAKHRPGEFYSLTAKTDNFGQNGEYNEKDFTTHHYMCLTDGVFVSKFGGGDVTFSSYKQILDAYFPAQFTVGHFDNEWY